MTLKEILDTFEENDFEDPGSLPDEADTNRYVLVEKNRMSGGIWITTFDDPADAASYLDSQEYPEDYETIGLHDTQTGETLGATTTTTFQKDAFDSWDSIFGEQG